MKPHVRAIIAAATHAFVTGKKVAGIYDHTAGRHLRIAAEAQAEHLQGYDGDRFARFGGTLPELREAGEQSSLHMKVEENEARGYDRSSSSHFTAKVTGDMVQLYDHAESGWYVFHVQVA